MGRATPPATAPSPRRRRVFLPAIAAVATLLLAPAIASAHPLGNFTINHYAGLTVGRDGVDVDIVIDMAEIPTFQERQTMDTDGDGSVGDDEAAAWATSTCTKLVPDLHLALGGAAVPIAAGAGTATFLPGAGGLSILHLECLDRAAFASPLTATSKLTFSDTSWSERIGWREIVATADGTTLDTHGLPATSPSRKLTAYPADLIAQPLDIRSATIDATPIAAAALPSAPAVVRPPVVATAPAPAAAAVPGGVASELPDVLQAPSFSPLAILLAIAVAVGLGAWHALTPGHGKTLLAAYLVGSRGTGIHAVGLGLSVAVSHTLGIVVLALLVVGAQSVLAPDVVVRTTPIVAAVSVVAIGGWMLIGEARRRRAAGRSESVHRHDQDPDHDHAHEARHDHPHETVAGEHAHGGIRHTHVPPDASSLSWRGLFVLGLAGGLIPSTSALLILLGSIAAGRPAFGLVLVIAFGLGMAAVMTGVGLAMVFARGRLDRVPSRSSLGRLAGAAPLLASVAVLGLGVVLTWSAVAGRPVL
jgi:nickel/cobalt transporter (NicO) family protein